MSDRFVKVTSKSRTRSRYVEHLLPEDRKACARLQGNRCSGRTVQRHRSEWLSRQISRPLLLSPRFVCHLQNYGFICGLNCMIYYPMNSTFVCPTEIISFSDRSDDFRKIGCEIVACSADSHFSHLAWYVISWSLLARDFDN